jgi:hypothetical protein
MGGHRPGANVLAVMGAEHAEADFSHQRPDAIDIIIAHPMLHFLSQLRSETRPRTVCSD